MKNTSKPIDWTQAVPYVPLMVGSAEGPVLYIEDVEFDAPSALL